jgi:16S rRNA (uracil1498-N3)-methyltransferase
MPALGCNPTQKATELGAFSLVPLITERSQSGSGRSKFKTAKGGQAAASAAAVMAADAEAAADFRPAGRLERLAAAAMKQAQRVHALELAPPAGLHQLLPRVRDAPLALVATGGAPPALRQLAAAAAAQGQGPASLGAW